MTHRLKEIKMKKLLIVLAFGLSASASITTFAAQNCNSAVIETAPLAQFTVNIDGTVTDSKTGLTWMRCALGKTWDGSTCTGAEGNYNWQAALDAAQATTFASQSDWRLPNIKELESINEYSCNGPALNITVFPDGISSRFWSSSTNEGEFSGAGAWAIQTSSGSTSDDSKSNTFKVRLVRD